MFTLSHENLGSVLMRKGKHKEGIQKLKEGNGYIIFDYCPTQATIRFFHNGKSNFR